MKNILIRSDLAVLVTVLGCLSVPLLLGGTTSVQPEGDTKERIAPPSTSITPAIAEKMKADHRKLAAETALARAANAKALAVPIIAAAPHDGFAVLVAGTGDVFIIDSNGTAKQVIIEFKVGEKLGVGYLDGYLGAPDMVTGLSWSDAAKK